MGQRWAHSGMHAPVIHARPLCQHEPGQHQEVACWDPACCLLHNSKHNNPNAPHTKHQLAQPEACDKQALFRFEGWISRGLEATRSKNEPTPHVMRDETARNSGLRTTASLVVVVQLPLLDCFRHLLRPINIVDLGELQQPMVGSSSHLGDLSGYFIVKRDLF